MIEMTEMKDGKIGETGDGEVSKKNKIDDFRHL